MGGFPSSTQILGGEINSSSKASSALTAIDEVLSIIFKHVNRESAVRAIFENRIARETFLEYLNCTVLDRIESILENHDQQRILFSVSDIQTILVRSVELVLARSSGDFTNQDLDTIARVYMVTEVVYDAFPLYLKSMHFYNWRAKEILETTDYLAKERAKLETTLPELIRVESMFNLSEEVYIAEVTFHYRAQLTKMKSTIDVDVISYSRASSTFPNHRQSQVIHANEVESKKIEDKIPHLIETSLSVCDPLEATTLLKSGSWLPLLLTAAETLPIGISLSTACTTKPGYPVVYINKYFEAMLGYKRNIIIGDEWKFMALASVPDSAIINIHTDLHKTQKDNNNKLFCALMSAESKVFTLANQRSNGEYFTNIVGIKPIIDPDSYFTYVLGIHIEPFRFPIHNDMDFVQNILDTLPDSKEYYVSQSRNTSINIRK
eukprot:gene8491-17502_t